MPEAFREEEEEEVAFCWWTALLNLGGPVVHPKRVGRSKTQKSAQRSEQVLPQTHLL